MPVVNGKATLRGFKLSAGTHAITAAYSGNGGDPAKTAVTVQVASSGGGGCTMNPKVGFEGSFGLLLPLGLAMRLRPRPSGDTMA